MKRICLALIAICLIATSAHAAGPIGFRQITVVDTENKDRPLDVAVWYPAEDAGETALIGDNPAFVGMDAVKEARPLPGGPRPLVVISHGSGGNWRNQMWLAAELVRSGYIVAAPDHPGTTSRDKRPSEAVRLRQRPHDLTRVINAVIAQPDLFGSVATGRIAAVGHSLGGWTVLAASGGRFDTDFFEKDCMAHSQLAACKVYKETGVEKNLAARSALGGNLRDARIKAAVSLDLGLARGFSLASLESFDIPVLIIAAGVDSPVLPAKLESAYLAGKLPPQTTRYVEIADAAHFSFLGICKPGATALIEERDPGEGIVCLDGAGRDRSAIHQQVKERVIRFLADSIP